MLRSIVDRLLKKGRKGPEDSAIQSVLRDGHATEVLRLVLENPGVSAESLAAHTGFADLEACLAVLSEKGLIASDASDPGFFVPASAKEAVVKYLPLNYQCPGMKRG